MPERMSVKKKKWLGSMVTDFALLCLVVLFRGALDPDIFHILGSGLAASFYVSLNFFMLED